VDASPESGRRSLERVREALDKVRKVLRDLDQDRHEPTPPAATKETSADATEHNDELRAHEAARLLSIPLKDLYAAVRDHRLRGRRMGRFLWFRREDVDAFAEQLARTGARQPRPRPPAR